MPELEDKEIEELETELENKEVEVEEEEEEETPVKNNKSQGDTLLELLGNPATAKSTLQTIASNLGLTISETKTEEGQAAIKDVIKLALGEDLAFLGDKLGPLGDAIERIINDRITKSEKISNERHQNQEATRFAAIIDTSMKALDLETKGEFNALLPKINALMEEMPIGKQTPDQYLRRLFSTAKSEAASIVKKPTSEKVEKARRESQGSSNRGQENIERVREGSSKNPTYREAIMAAISGKKI